MTDSDSSTRTGGQRGRLTRRSFTAAVAAGTALLAGCSGGGGDDETPTEGGGGGTTSETGTTTGGGGTTTSATTSGTTASGPSEPSKPDGLEPPAVDSGTKQVEYFSTRGLVPLYRPPAADGILLRWRLFATDPENVGFHVYRNGEQITDEPVTGSTNYLDMDGTYTASYQVAAVADGEELDRSQEVDTWQRDYKEIDLLRPNGPDDVTYSPNDCATGDLTGNGVLDIVVKWTPSNANDPAQDGDTANTYLDAYTWEGEQLWRVDLGPNVRAGAHTTPFLVYDFDGDGVAELAVRTSDGAVSGTGETIGDPDADHTNDTGHINEGPEFMTVFDGQDGSLLARTAFEPARGSTEDWGDSSGNREDRYLMTPAYLDGARPSIVSNRGYYAKTAVAAFDFRDGELSLKWKFDSDDGHSDYEGRGSHTIGAADVDDDGKDEVIHGGMAIDHDGSPLHTSTMQNPDVLHYGDFLPDRDGMEIFVPAENPPEGWPSASLRDGETGEYIWSKEGGDVPRAVTADIDPEFKGNEFWAAGMATWKPNGDVFLEDYLESYNSVIWWTGDLQRELMDAGSGDPNGTGRLLKFDAGADLLDEFREFEETMAINGSKGNPCLSGDLLGDWREEVVWRTQDNESLRLYVTNYETEQRLPCQLHDPTYRIALARQNAGYNQPPWPSYYIGSGMGDPPDFDVKPV